MLVAYNTFCILYFVNELAYEIYDIDFIRLLLLTQRLLSSAEVWCTGYWKSISL